MKRINATTFLITNIYVDFPHCPHQSFGKCQVNFFHLKNETDVSEKLGSLI